MGKEMSGNGNNKIPGTQAAADFMFIIGRQDGPLPCAESWEEIVNTRHGMDSVRSLLPVGVDSSLFAIEKPSEMQRQFARVFLRNWRSAKDARVEGAKAVKDHNKLSMVDKQIILDSVDENSLFNKHEELSNAYRPGKYPMLLGQTTPYQTLGTLKVVYHMAP